MDDPVSSTPPPPKAVPLEWSAPRRFLLRFGVVYFLLYSFPFPLGAIPFGLIGHDKLPWSAAVGRFAEALSTWVFAPWQTGVDRVVRWVGEHVLRVSVTVGPMGSGDTTWNYVQLACTLTAALLLAGLWSLFARRTASPRLFAWFRWQLRYVLALALLGYGAYKVIPAQMPLPDLERLAQPYGESSPMGLLWTFIGAVPAFERFSGCAEIFAGLLLLQRRTATLGALVGGGVMLNVAAFNYFFDVPVKLYSSHLLLMALLIALPDAMALLRLLAARGSIGPLHFDRLFESRWLRAPGFVVRYVVVGWALWQTLGAARQQEQSFHDPANQSPLRGIWDVTTCVVDGRPGDGFAAEPACWRQLIVSYPRRAALVTVGDPYERYGTAFDFDQRTLVLTRYGQPDWKAEFTFEQPSLDRLRIDGTMDGRALRVELKLAPERSWLLLDRGFRWINETPFNR